MAYKSNRSEALVAGTYVLANTIKADGSTGREIELTYDSYEEYEDGYLFYSETTYHFDAEDGARDFNSEDEAVEWLEANGYTNEY